MTEVLTAAPPRWIGRTAGAPIDVELTLLSAAGRTYGKSEIGRLESLESERLGTLRAVEPHPVLRPSRSVTPTIAPDLLLALDARSHTTSEQTRLEVRLMP